MCCAGSEIKTLPTVTCIVKGRGYFDTGTLTYPIYQSRPIKTTDFQTPGQTAEDILQFIKLINEMSDAKDDDKEVEATVPGAPKKPAPKTKHV